jgi:hypothetical protein
MPAWVVILQALAVPAIAVFGIWFTRQQVDIARTKLRYDLFDKRYAVLVTARELLGHIFAHGNVTMEQLGKYTLGIIDARYLLDDSLSDYLLVIPTRAIELQTRRAATAWEPVGLDKLEMAKKAGNDIQWLIGQTDVLAEKFKPFLTLEPKTKSAWWQWQS